MSTENSEVNFNIPLTLGPEKHDQKQGNIYIMCDKIGQQQVENLNLVTKNLGNEFTCSFIG